MWDDCGGYGYDYGCYDPYYDPCYGGGFFYEPWVPMPMVVPYGGYYPGPYVREEVVHHYPNQQQPQVVVVNNKKGKSDEVEYVMVDPNDKEGKRVIKIDPQKVKEGAYVIDDQQRTDRPTTLPANAVPASTVPASKQSPTVIVQRPVSFNQAPPGRKKKRSSCCCC